MPPLHFLLLLFTLFALLSPITSIPLMNNRTSVIANQVSSDTNGSFYASGSELFLNGKPFRLLSGSFHYFRTPRAYWRDRLIKLRYAGLNTVETYLPWNLIEPRPGSFDISGEQDFEAFINEAESLGLYVIIRPGPYICAEWDMGGLPSWLLANGTNAVQLRSRDPNYLAAVDRYLDAVIPILARKAINNGGPVIMLQIENEYMSYGRNQDVGYIEYLRDAYIARGIDPEKVLLFTSDNTNHFLPGPDDLLRTLNFGPGTNVGKKFSAVRRAQGDKPVIVMEFWCGWYDWWDGPHKGAPLPNVVKTLKKILESGGHVNFYMFVGGTSFGFLSGANIDYIFRPMTTSYDYDAPIAETGDLTEKYWAVREILLQYTTSTLDSDVPKNLPKRKYGKVEFHSSISIFDALPQLVPSGPILSELPQYMETYNQSHGLILYRTTMNHTQDSLLPNQDILLSQLHDRAHVFINGELQGIAKRIANFWLGSRVPVKLPPAPAQVQIDVLVESMGRVNYGEGIADSKGVEGLVFGHFGFGSQLHDFEVYPLELHPDDLSRLNFSLFNPIPLQCGEKTKYVPTFYLATLNITTEPDADTFLMLPALKKGIAWINGHPLGRYWRVGPQQSLYVPRSFLNIGTNQLIVLELDGILPLSVPEAEFGDKMMFGKGPVVSGECDAIREESLWGSGLWPWIPLFVVVSSYIASVIGIWQRRRGYQTIR